MQWKLSFQIKFPFSALDSITFQKQKIKPPCFFYIFLFPFFLMSINKVNKVQVMINSFFFLLNIWIYECLMFDLQQLLTNDILVISVLCWDWLIDSYPCFSFFFALVFILHFFFELFSYSVFNDSIQFIKRSVDFALFRTTQRLCLCALLWFLFCSSNEQKWTWSNLRIIFPDSSCSKKTKQAMKKPKLEINWRRTEQSKPKI